MFKKLLVIFLFGIIFLGIAFVSINNKISYTNMKISSPAFENNGSLSVKYTCDGEGLNPPLEFSGVPAEAKSLKLVVDDPDAPSGTYTHWVVENIDPFTKKIEEGKNGYIPACPPSGTHRYFFKLYALDANGKEIAHAELVGLYKRK